MNRVDAGKFKGFVFYIIMTYFEKLKNPKWQKKRLEFLEEHDFTCQVCGDNETELHVHHTNYKKGFEPWEYTSDELMCLCKDCHEDWHKVHEEIKSVLASHSLRWLLSDVLDMLKIMQEMDPVSIISTVKAITVLKKAYSHEIPY